MKTKINTEAIAEAWGVLNLTLGSSMTKEECLEIVKKLDDISLNKFYTINVWDSVADLYFGDVGPFADYAGEYVIINNYISTNSSVNTYTYRFYKSSGVYERIRINRGKISDILSRLDKIEQKLNEITAE